MTRRPAIPQRIQALRDLRLERVGLAIGPDASHGPKTLDALAAFAVERSSAVAGGSFLDLLDSLAKVLPSRPHVEALVNQFYAQRPVTPTIGALAEVRWAAVLSADPSGAFRTEFSDKMARNLIHPRVVELDVLSKPAPPRSIPVLPLIGSVDRGTFLLGSGDFYRKRTAWRHGLQLFRDLVKFSPLVLTGFESDPWLLRDLMAELTAPSYRPSKIILAHAERSLLNDQVLLDTLDAGQELLLIDGTIGEIAAVLNDRSTPRVRQSTTPSSQKLLDRFHELAVAVNSHLVTTALPSERARLHELLFSPSLPRWDPYCHGLDLPRAIGKTFETAIRERLTKDKIDSGVFLLTGSAASGKTTVLKRLAWNLAKDDYVVLWLKPFPYPDAPRALSELLAEVGRQKLDAKRQVVIFVDDPLQLGSFRPGDVAASARANEIDAVVITACRTADKATHEQSFLIGNALLAGQAQMPETLDEEWEGLPAYLVKLGIADTLDAGKLAADQAKSRRASDTLSLLYWLLPETRAAIHASVQDEYFRLGDTAGFAKIVLGAQKHSSSILKNAYEYVVVADRYHAALPVEVLVRALEVDYQSWLEAEAAASNGGWGLFYSDMDDSSETIVYRPRNEIAARIILTALNGGTYSNAAEVKRLHELLCACSGSHPVYREFCVQVLVNNRTLADLPYGEGLSLFDAALTSIPAPDKTLAHHKALWVKNHGDDPLFALKLLDDALATPVSPYASRAEADEHIFTSKAATTLDALSRKLIDVDRAKRDVLSLLRQARSDAFFNPKAVHVGAGLILRLVRSTGDLLSEDSVHLANMALEDVERTLLLLGNRFAGRAGLNPSDPLIEVRDKILAQVIGSADIVAYAKDLWKQNGNQDGMVLAARKLLSDARTHARGSDYKTAADFVQTCLGAVTGAGKVITPGLREVRLLLTYEWLIHRSPGASAVAVPWKQVSEDAAALLKDIPSQMTKYLFALSLAHLSQWDEAGQVFHQLRTSGLPGYLLWEPRDFLRGPSGGPTAVQGTIRQGVSRVFLNVESLKTDLYAERGESWPAEDEIATAYVQFSFAGPLAVRQLPGHMKLR